MIEPIKTIKKTKPYSPPLQNRSGKIRLDFNENNYGPSPKLSNLTSNISQNSIYPEDSRLIEKLSQKFNLNKNMFLIGNGSNEIISLIANTYLSKNDEVLIPCPTFSIYNLLFSLKNAKLVEINYNLDFSFPIKEFLSKITSKTKMIVLVNPNNPTGTSIKKEDFTKIMKKAKNALVVLDEAYCHFAQENFLSSIKKYDNLFLLRTFSKAYSLAGFRVGFLISNSENIQNISKFALPYRINYLSLEAAIIALDDQKYLDDTLQKITLEKIKMQKALKKMRLEYIKTNTNFLLIKTGIWSTKIHKILEKKGILVRNLTDKPMMEKYLRVTIGNPSQNKIFLCALSKLWKNRLVILDVDGTLVNVESSYISTIVQTVKYYKGQMEKEAVEEIRSQGGYNNDWDLTEYALRNQKIYIDKQEIIDKFQEFYESKKKEEFWLLDKEILAELQKKYTLAIFTGRPEQELEFVLNRFDTRSYFEKCVCMEDTKDKSKPSPFGVEILQNFYKSKLVCYIGDTLDDVDSAKSADAISITVNGIEQADYKLKGIDKIEELLL